LHTEKKLLRCPALFLREKERLENLAARRKPAFPKQGSYGGMRHSLSRGT
jgi:hypothetical protein